MNVDIVCSAIDERRELPTGDYGIARKIGNDREDGNDNESYF